jgi:hypothetical protein
MKKLDFDQEVTSIMIEKRKTFKPKESTSLKLNKVRNFKSLLRHGVFK